MTPQERKVLLARALQERARRAGTRSPDPSRANRIAEEGIQQGIAEGHVQARPFATRVQSFNQGLPFVGEYLDEAAGFIGGPEATAQMRADTNALATARPIESAAWHVGGGMAGGLTALPLASAYAPATMAGRVAAGAGAGTVLGGTEGAVSGYGMEGDRVENALNRGAIGAATGLAVGAAAPLAATGLRNAFQRLRGTDVRTIAQELGVSPESARVIRDTLQADDLGQGAQNIARGGQDAMLADAGHGTRALADAVAASPGPGGRVMRDAVDQRATAASQRLTGAMDQAMGPAQGRASLAEGIRRSTAGPRDAAYKAAYAHPIDYSSPAGRAIEDTLHRAPPNTVLQAVKSANDRMRFDAMQGQVMAQIGDDGNVVFQQMPSAIELDYIKRGFDDIVRNGTDATTGKLSADAAFAQRVSREIKLRHAAANPAYRTALRTAGDSLQMEEAVETGYGALRTATSRESVATAMRGASKPQRDAARSGVRQYIDDQMANARTVLSDPGRSEEIAEAIKGINDLSTRAAQSKLRTILGRDADGLIREMEEVRTAFQLRAALATGSKTAPRQAQAASIANQTEPGAIGTLLQGEPLAASKRVIQVLTGATKDMQELRKQGIYEEIARALTQRRGPAAERAVQIIDQAMQGQPVRERDARIVANALTSAAALGGYQTGTQLLGR